MKKTSGTGEIDLFAQRKINADANARLREENKLDTSLNTVGG